MSGFVGDAYFVSIPQFIDLCILLGCDYCDSIRGIGPHRAVQLIREHKNLETILKTLDPKKYKVPEDWPYEQARELFKNPSVKDPADVDVRYSTLGLLEPSHSLGKQLKWRDPDEEGIVEFLVKEKQFK